MTAGILTGSTEAGSGLQPVNPRRHMRAMADLLEVAFAGQLDAAGRRMVREIRSLGRLGWLGWLFGHLLLPPAARPQGYVWIEDGQLVGNASLLPVRGYPERWVMANVAVHPDYRRRGIASQLVSACEQLAWKSGARSVVLQVESQNHGAQELYLRQGFRQLRTRSSWRGTADVPSAQAHPPEGEWPRSEEMQAGGLPQSRAAGQIQLSRGEQWRAHLALAQRVAPEGVVWPFPLAEEFFQPKRRTHHWLYWEGERLLGGLSLRVAESYRLALVVDPSVEGQIEAELVGPVLAAAGRSWSAVLLDYPTGVATEQLRALGLHERRRLTWMAKEFAA